MGNNNQARYVDAEKLKMEIYGAIPHLSVPFSGDQLSSAINTQINEQIRNAFMSFVSTLSMAIDRASQPYTQCMLCTRKDHDITPSHPLGDNR